MKKIRNRRTSLRFCCITAMLCKFIYVFFNLDFYNFYLYFYFVSIPLFFFALSPWGEITKTNLIIRYGLFNKKKLYFPWSEIKKIGLKKIEINKLFISSGESYIPFVSKVERTVLKIKLKELLSFDQQSILIKQKNKTYLTNKIEQGEDKQSILIHTKPEYGYRDLINTVSPFILVKKDQMRDNFLIIPKSMWFVFDICLCSLFIYSLFT